LSNFGKISKLTINDYHKYFYVNQNVYIILYKTTVDITITYAWSILIRHIIGALIFNDNILRFRFCMQCGPRGGVIVVHMKILSQKQKHEILVLGEETLIVSMVNYYHHHSSSIHMFSIDDQYFWSPTYIFYECSCCFG